MFGNDRQASSVSKANPVFVVGIFRSGTSLLYALLNQHPQIALMFECNVLDFPEAFSRRRLKGNWLERQEFFNKALSRHRLIFANRLSGLENVRTPEELYRAYSEGKRARFFGEKAPAYSLRLRQLAQRYPDASFILIWRNPLETYRSVLQAGRKVRFFRHFGVSRFIFYQEQMVRQAAELEFAGAKTHHIRYADLVDRSEATCRGICQFLNIEFDPAMLDLARADLSATHTENQRDVHGQLMRGIIERRKFSENGMDAAVAQKLQRFHARWRRLGGERLPDAASDIEPSLTERFYHGMAGRFLFLADNTKRVLMEFLPLKWLKAYRHTKNWFRRGQSAGDGSFAEDFAASRVTILTCGLFLTAVASVDLMMPPQMVLIPFYLAPASILALTVSRRWGSVGALVSALVWTAAKIPEQPESHFHYGLLFWNCFMRFVALQFIVLLLNRIRLEVASPDYD